jgi:hypothetical protein
LSEEHHIAGAARGEPGPANQIGVRVRVPLSGTPTSQWSRVLGAHMVAELTGHPAVGHMHMDNIVQGAEIVLDGVEEREAGSLGPIVARAVDAANRACRRTGDQPAHANTTAEEAERIAGKVTLSAAATSPPTPLH